MNNIHNEQKNESVSITIPTSLQTKTLFSGRGIDSQWVNFVQDEWVSIKTEYKKNKKIGNVPFLKKFNKSKSKKKIIMVTKKSKMTMKIFLGFPTKNYVLRIVFKRISQKRMKKTI